MGLPAEHGFAWLLPRLLGDARAAELLLGSPVIVAERALELGLIHQVHPREQVLDAALAYAATVATEMAPASLRMIKAQLYAHLEPELRAAVRTADAYIDEALTGVDYREAVAAYRERRPARF
jgi:enoyl-CoA hydratase/carnithine racemase